MLAATVCLWLGMSAGCGGDDVTELRPTEAAAPELPAPSHPWRSGIDRRPSATAFASTFPGQLEVKPAGWVTAPAFPALTFDTAVFLAEAPGTGHLFVAQRDGRIYAFANDPDVRQKRLVLDLSPRTQGDTDSGLLGFAFHPEFGSPASPRRGYIYLHYAFRSEPIPGSDVPVNTPTLSRLARFTVELDTLVIDPATELVLIDQQDDDLWHQGGAMFFHPLDGFLYIAVGDEGHENCQLGNCQRIDKDLFSGVLRIDVDQRGGDISHPIPRQPATGRTANYFIPNDNPFVGRPGVLEEFYALGLRSPHRMTHDIVDGITWIADVGQLASEELDVLRPGANYQWNVLEGSQPSLGVMPREPIGTWTPPLLEIDRRHGRAIIGGYVYRGVRLPYLAGKYVFGDFVDGNLWALTYSHDGERTEPLSLELLVKSPFRGRANGITSFGVDAAGELYLLVLGPQTSIQRLERAGEPHSNAPLRLSETGLFVDTASPDLEPDASLVPYDVRSPLWSDGARKSRWVSVPDATVVGFADTGSWLFPEGSVFVKHFELVLDEARPDVRRRLETRVLVQGDGDSYYGVTYKWNGAQTDADLVFESITEPIDVKLADGRRRHIDYFYPAAADCNICHNPSAGGVLGARTSQLNHEFVYPRTGRSSNQVYSWGQAGLLDASLDEPEVRQLPSSSALTDSTASNEARLRSYWAANCSMCHGHVSGLRASWDARFDVALEARGLIDVTAHSAGAEVAVLVLPGDPERSVLYQRSRSTDPALRMPPVGRSATDTEYVELLGKWIEELDDK